MMRYGIIAKRHMEYYCNGKEEEKDSVNDDLETFFEDLRLGKEPKKMSRTYFFPQLTAEEEELCC